MVSALALGLISVSGGLVYFAFRDSALTQVVERTSSQTKYVLVNEDDGQEFEGAPYNLGNDFVTFISQDTKNQWETANRNLAETGLENGQYDAMIIIPKDFSKNILSLQSISPEKANIEYKIRDGQTQVTNQVIQKNVNGVLYDFNKRIVQMYFSSIVGSLAEAQQSLNDMMDVDSKSNAFLESKIRLPFQTLPESFSSVSSLASTLQTNTDAVEAQQKSFMDAMNAMMTDNSTSGSASSDSSPGASGDATSPSTNSGLDGFYTNLNGQLNLLQGNQNNTSDGTNGPNADTIYDRFLNQSKRFEENQGLRKSQLDNQIQTIQGQLKGLRDIQSSIAFKYYGDSTKTPDSATVEDAKYSIASLMNSRQDSKLSTDYLNNIDGLVQAVPSSGLDQLIDDLLAKNAITPEQAAKYKSELSLVTKYAADRGISGSGVSFNLVDNQGGTDSVNTQMTTTLKVSSKGDTLTLSGDGVTLTNGAEIAGQIQSSLNQQLAPFNRTATVSSNGNTISIQVIQHSVQQVEAIPATSDGVTSNNEGATVSENSAITGANDSTPSSDVSSTSTPTNPSTADTTDSNRESKPTESDKQAIPDFIPVTVDVNLSVSPDTASNQSYKESAYQWNSNSGVIGSGKLVTVTSSDGDISKDLPAILANFNSLDQASQQITTIFADPNESVESFSGRISGNGAPLTEVASSSSIYYRYNNSELKSLAGNVSDSFAQSYKNDGDQLYRSLNGQISELEKFLGNENSPSTEDSLYGQLNSLTDKAEYYQLLTELSDWRTKTSELLEDYYKGEKSASDAKSAEDQSKLNQANEQLKNLQKTTQDLNTNTRNAADSVVSDNSAIRNFSQRTEQLQTDANTLLGSVNQYASETGGNLAENKEYAESFSKVLANAKNGGADNLRVFNFLSSPIDITAIQGTTARLSIIPYYMTVIGALIIASASYFVLNLLTRRKLEVADKLRMPSRFWSNTPNLFRVSTVALAVSSAYSIATTYLVKTNFPTSWFLYTLLFVYSAIMLFTYLLRKVKRTTGLYVFAFLFGIYLLLMPIIGTSTKPGSVVSFIYRFSPFQNIENGYTAMINGTKIGLGTLLIMLVIAIIAVVLNWSKKDSKS